MGERILAPDVPTGRCKGLHDKILELRMAGIQEPIELRATPSGRKRYIDIEHAGDSAVRVDREHPQAAAFEIGDRLL